MKLHRCTGFSPHRLPATLLILAFGLGAASAATSNSSDSSAITWAARAMAALTGGVTVTSATLQGTAIRGDAENEGSVPISLQATSAYASHIDISTQNGTLSLLRWSDGNGHQLGSWIGTGTTSHAIAQHNCWTDSVWFFPALSLLSQYADPTLVFSDLGQETRNGATVEHIRVHRVVANKTVNMSALIAQLSTVDYYLDSSTAVPVAITYFDHPNYDALTNLSIEIDFSNFQLVGSRIVPFGITRLQNGLAQFQIAITTATLN